MYLPLKFNCPRTYSDTMNDSIEFKIKLRVEINVMYIMSRTKVSR